MNALVSVIVPAYNAGDSIEKCLTSIISQTYENLEVIIINDGSTDDTEKLAEKICQKDKRMHYLKQENAGVSAARNRGIRLSHGDCLMFCDSDDYMRADCVERLLESMERFSSDWVIGGYALITGTEIAEETRVYGEERVDSGQMLTFLSEWYKNPHVSGPCFKLYRRELIGDGVLFPEDMDYGEDFVFNIRYMARCQSVSFVNEALYFYVRQKRSLTNRNLLGIWDRQLQIYREFSNMLALRGYPAELSYTFLVRGLLLSLEHAAFNDWSRWEWNALCRDIRGGAEFQLMERVQTQGDWLAGLSIGLLWRKQFLMLRGLYELKRLGRRYLRNVYIKLKKKRLYE